MSFKVKVLHITYYSRIPVNLSKNLSVRPCFRMNGVIPKESIFLIIHLLMLYILMNGYFPTNS